jgi:hypothetical protein
MTSRLTHAAAIWALALALAAPAAAQRAGTVEVGAFARYTDLDKSLGMGTTIALGGRAAVYLGQTLALEVDAAHASGRSVGFTPLHVRLVLDVPVAPRLDGLLGGGYVHNWYGAPYGVSDGGLSAVVGARYHLTSRMWLRFGSDLDFMIHTSAQSPFSFYHGNWGLHLGMGTRLGS